MYIPVTTHTGATESYCHVNPDILECRSLLSNGFKNILSLTPYTNQDDAYENPSLAFSKNLENWNENEVPILYILRDQNTIILILAYVMILSKIDS